MTQQFRHKSSDCASRAGFPAGTENFAYQNGSLAVENVVIADIAAAVGTPFYVYSAGAILGNFKRLAALFGDLDMMIAYAVKANSNQAVLKLLAQAGAGADIVSGGELYRALAAGINPQKIVYSGVGKTEEEMDFALKSNIFCFNVESVAELRQLSERARHMRKKAAVALRINPDIDARTHAKIATGKAENKFGIPHKEAGAAYADAAALPNIEICGADVHIGSQIETPAPYARAFAFAADLVRELRAQGFPIRHLDIGGGLGIAYNAAKKPPITAELYAALVKKHLSGLGLSLICEPGRFIVGNGGALIMRVLSVKRGSAKNIIIVDAAMNDLIRPTLYEAWHEIVPIAEAEYNGIKALGDIVGPVCETGDYLALNRALPMPNAGALLAVLSCGAYGASMANTYNSRLLIPEVLVKGDRFAVIRPRETYADMAAKDIVPEWLQQ